jgi:hypothetical protein
MRYGIFGLLLVLIVVLGVVESSLAWPVFSVGILLFAVRDSLWWQRLVILWLVGLIWSSSMLISAWILILILFVAAWIYRWWLMGRISARQSLAAITLASALIIGVFQGVTINLTTVILYILQGWLFWQLARLVSYRHTNALLFIVPPQSLSSSKTHGKS